MRDARRLVGSHALKNVLGAQLGSLTTARPAHHGAQLGSLGLSQGAPTTAPITATFATAEELQAEGADLFCVQRPAAEELVSVVTGVPTKGLPREALPCLSLAETLSEGSHVTGSMGAAIGLELLDSTDVIRS